MIDDSLSGCSSEVEVNGIDEEAGSAAGGASYIRTDVNWGVLDAVGDIMKIQSDDPEGKKPHRQSKP